MKPSVQALDHLVLTVADIDATTRFYTDVLGMVAQAFTPADGSTRWSLSFGAQKINLHQAGAEFSPHAQTPMTGTADVCFLSDTPLADWQTHLSALEVEVIQGPVRRTGAQFAIQSLYLRDPDGNLIEISNRA